MKIINFLKNWLIKNWRFFLLGLAIFVFFFGFYYKLGMSLARTHALLERDNLFQADPPRVIADMTKYTTVRFKL